MTTYYLKVLNLETFVDANGIKYKIPFDLLSSKDIKNIHFIKNKGELKGKVLRFKIISDTNFKIGRCNSNLFNKKLKKQIPYLTVITDETTTLKKTVKRKSKSKKSNIKLRKKHEYKIGDFVRLSIFGSVQYAKVLALTKRESGEVTYKVTTADGMIYPNSTHEHGSVKAFVILDKIIK